MFGEAEISNRLNKSLKIYHAMRNGFIKNNKVSKATKIKVYTAIYRPVLTFGCETWNLDEKQKSRVQALEMLYLRRVRGVTEQNKIRNQVN